MVDLPGPADEPTMNGTSFAGRKMETLCRVGMVGRDGYAKVTLCSASSPEHLSGVIFLRTWRFLDCGVDVAREMREAIENFPLVRMMNLKSPSGSLNNSVDLGQNVRKGRRTLRIRP